jgi:acyl-CoA thioesterase-2
VPANRVETDMLGLLDLEELDTNLYRGYNEKASHDRPALFGGQVAAQALRAAASTVPEGRFPNSLHGYFLRPGRVEHPVILQVARDRDGRSFSARHVVALQQGEVIFSMSASFHLRKEGVEFAVERAREWVPPEELEDRTYESRFAFLFDVRPQMATRPYDDTEEQVPARIWARVKGELPDDPIVHACALTYLSDVGSGFADGTVPGVPRGGPSIDHAVWFHLPLRVDDWILLDSWPLKTIGSRGLYEGSMHDRQGRLGGLLMQEVLFRGKVPPQAADRPS